MNIASRLLYVRRATHILAFAFSVLIRPAALHAQWIGHQTGCYAPEIKATPTESTPIEAIPNRPTVANPADVTQYGVLELEYGWDRTSLGAGARLDDLVGLLKFGLFCDVELRWATTSLLVQNGRAGGQTGIGDNFFGPHIRFYRQTKYVPSLALTYAVKWPTASTAKRLGSGRVDHLVTFLASKTIHGTGIDFNASYFFIGRPGAIGFDRNAQLNLAFSHDLKGRFAFQGEVYGTTELNALTPGFASSLWALVFTITPRLIIDGGVDVGLTHGAPQKRVFAGVTYSISNIYLALKRKPSSEAN